MRATMSVPEAGSPDPTGWIARLEGRSRKWRGVGRVGWEPSVPLLARSSLAGPPPPLPQLAAPEGHLERLVGSEICRLLGLSVFWICMGGLVCSRWAALRITTWDL